MASFFAPPEPEPDFEDIVTTEASRFATAAREAGLPAEEHVRIIRHDTEVCVEISPALKAVFEPEQTLWKAQ
jgi:hypothetical protein